MQRLQTCGVVPGLAPVPWQVGQAAETATVTGHLRALHRLVEGDVDLGLEVAAALGLRAAAAAAASAEEVGDDVAEPAREALAGRGSVPGSKPPPKMPPPESYSRRFLGSDRMP